MTRSQLERRVRFLTAYAVGSILLFVIVAVAAFRPDTIATWQEMRATTGEVDTLQAEYVTAQRLDVVERDGRLALSLSNSEHTPLPQIDGEELHMGEPREAPAIIFFDGQGDEVGGLLFANEETKAGHFAARHFSMDGFEQDQVVYLSHHDEGGTSETGLHVQDRPATSFLEALEEMGIDPSDDRAAMQQKMEAFRKENEARYRKLMHAPHRLFVGTTREGQSTLALRDGEGRPRIRASVAEDGTAALEFLDEDGAVVNRLAPDRE